MAKNIQLIPARRELADRSAQRSRKVRLAAYARVSTSNEDQLESFDNQVTHYRNYTKNHPEYTLVDIYADEGISGTNTRRRREFQRMIADCENGKIDMVITKSISRFSRNTQDCLHYARKLKDLHIPIYFEKENINTLDGTGEVLFTILSSLAQDESRSISENSSWGIRALFRQGKLQLNADHFLGYDKNAEGDLIINEVQAAIVRRIFSEFIHGRNPGSIAHALNEEGIPGISGKPAWQTSTITAVLKNEKYMGDALLQKYYNYDFLAGRSIPNNGALPQYYIHDNHPAIIDKRLWNAVQQELERQRVYREEHGLHSLGRNSSEIPFSCKVVCSQCNRVYQRRTWYRGSGEKYVWVCGAHYGTGEERCNSDIVQEDDLHWAFILGWNHLLRTRDERIAHWEDDIANGSELKSVRAEQMLNLTADSIPLTEIDLSVVQQVLDHVVVDGKNNFRICLLDGAQFMVDIDKEHVEDIE